MTNNDIAAFFITQMTAMLTEQGHPEVEVVTSFQTDNQGRLDGPVLYFAEVADDPYGAQKTATTKTVDDEIVDVSAQRMRITFQVQGFTPVNKTDLTVLRASDVVKMALMLLKSPPFLKALKAQNMGIERIPTTKPTLVVNDRAQYEAGPMFEFTLSYKRSIIQKSAVITTADIAIHRV